MELKNLTLELFLSPGKSGVCGVGFDCVDQAGICTGSGFRVQIQGLGLSGTLVNPNPPLSSGKGGINLKR